ncbi:MAG TPA: energy transducer TonB [Terriglobales bacterium]|nr:energy transducer TonB [Terriglobales bacterium]
MTTPLDPRPVTKAPAAAPAAASGSDPRGAGPIPKEIPIVATGARQGGGSGPRELFCEDTTTVLVFEKGAVIRLSVAVVPGQLIFLTNLQTKKEVVAQAMLKRSTRTNNSYAELQFTEEAADFWGVDFSKSQAAAAAVPGTPALEVPRAEETAAERPPLELAAPAAEEVEKLREEVEALRQKLASLTHAPAPASPALQAAKAVQAQARTSEQDAPRSDELTAALLNAATSPARPSVAPEQKLQGENAEKPSATELTAALLSATAAPQAVPARDSLPTMALPKAVNAGEGSGSHSRTDKELGSLVHQSETMDLEGEVLPEASLDFDSAPPEMAAAASSGKGTSKLRLALLFAALALCAAVGMWYEHWLPRALATKLPAPEALSSFHGAGSAAHRSKPAPFLANKPKPLPVAMQAASEGNTGAETASAAPEESVKPSAEEPKERVRENAPAEKEPEASRGERSEQEPSSEVGAGLQPASNVVPQEAAPGRGTLVPPKLLKSVRPEAPARAIRSYVTGNVQVDALVNTDGHVASAEALSGPDVLRDAAIATVKQYKYTPATRGGKAVPAHVKVMVQFWYEP